ncbi:MAG: 50S ribosomal protein L32 [Elusimicrobia bacterium]|nr:50S ribosomal protein L32 [Elusimicrobiota bacterium]
MPNPKSKHTRHRTGIRRASNWRIAAVATTECPQCHEPKLPHRVCSHCGFYAGRAVLPPKLEKPKKDDSQQQQ